MNADLEAALRRSAPPGNPDGSASAARQASDRAAAEGLVDLAYTVVPSPLGNLVLVASPRGLVTVAYEDGRLDALLDRLAARATPRLLDLPARLDGVRRELEEYFDGSRRTFDLVLDWALVRGFTRRVLEATARIPYGGASTYLDVAAAAGSPRAVRAAGNALGANPMPIVVPCHRVLRTGGGLGGYTGGLERKRRLLELESGSEA
ncbi:MAG: methylated-DNA--[protein]-cysteine S-methyltransferase [Actinomycetota bacterium]|nr:methylated-DNA--[protein]-cysteine S-methyltransferase [Actinomycetota bacterium]